VSLYYPVVPASVMYKGKEYAVNAALHNSGGTAELVAAVAGTTHIVLGLVCGGSSTMILTIKTGGSSGTAILQWHGTTAPAVMGIGLIAPCIGTKGSNLHFVVGAGNAVGTFWYISVV